MTYGSGPVPWRTAMWVRGPADAARAGLKSVVALAVSPAWPGAAGGVA